MTDDALVHGVAAAIAPYRGLLEDFVAGKLPAEEFETRYLDAYLNNEADCAYEVFGIVDRFFADVDAYVADPAVRDLEGGDLGPEELRDRARTLLRRAGFTG